MFQTRFWGVRGSIPCPGKDTVIYGGNTACVEIRVDGRLLIVDLGTGARPLGEFLMKNDFKKNGKIDADIFITHTHWDHIMGFPSFAPIYIPGSTLRMTGPVSFEAESLEDIMRTQLLHRFWPVRAGELSSHIQFNQIQETTLDLGGGLTVTSKFLNHTVMCLGYRFDYKGRSVVTVFDHEPYRNLFNPSSAEGGADEQAAKEGALAAEEENKKILDFIRDADLVIQDTQYSQEEYSTHVGWGHSSFDHALNIASGANVKQMVFFHHEPTHSDRQLKEIEKFYKKKSPIKIIMAKEGMTLEIK
jgi:phosphoribosyl 1,2-cyclic phosphodiesterase